MARLAASAGTTASLVLHGAVGTVLVVGWPYLNPPAPEPLPPIPVELISEAEIADRVEVREQTRAEEPPEEPEPEPEPVEAPEPVVEAAPPEPAPDPAPEPEVPPAPEPEPDPQLDPEPEEVEQEPEPPEEPEPEPEPVEAPEPVVEAAPPEPAPDPAPEPEVPPAPEPEPDPQPDPEPEEVEPEPEPEPDPPAPEPDPEPEELDFASLEDDLVNLDPDERAAPREVADEGEGAEVDAERVGLGQRLLASEEAMIKGRVEGQCWNRQSGVPDIEKLVVTVRFQLDPQGRIVGTPRVVNAGQISRSGNAFWRVAQDRAVAAVRACEPYDYLSQDRYDVWRDIEMNFIPPS